MDKKLVYIASPYTKGDQALNVRFQMRIWDVLLDLGVVPVAPLWSHFQHMHSPRTYDEWVAYDNEIIKRCDVLVRLDANESTPAGPYTMRESPGADAEVALALSLGKPVCYSIFELAFLLGKVSQLEAMSWSER
jgi:hypothetical protein